MNTTTPNNPYIEISDYPRWMHVFSLLMVFLLSFSFPYQGFTQSNLGGLPFIKNFSPQTYKAGIQNWDIAQDTRGVLFFANNYGLLEYDGNTWQNHSVRNGSKMRSIAQDSDGRIYVGCQVDFGFFFPNERGQLVYTSLADSLLPALRNFDEAWSTFINKDKVYFCTFSRIYIYNKVQKDFTIIESESPLEHSFFVNQQLYVKKKNLGLAHLIGDSLQLMDGGSFFAAQSISSVLPIGKNRLLVSTFHDGIYEWQENKLIEWSKPNGDLFREAIINCVLMLRNGDLAIGTQNKGLLIMSSKGEMLMQLFNGKGLQSRTVLSLYEDDLGNLWIGQNNGISYVELGSPFSHMNEESGVPGTGYAALLNENNLYLGTNNGLYQKNIQETIVPPKLIQGTRGQVYHVGNYGGELLMGHHNGSYRIDGDVASKISEEVGAWVFSVMPDSKQHDLMGGTYNGLQIFKKENGHWKFKKKLNHFNESSRVMEFGENHELWMTHGYKGAYKIIFDGDSIRSVTHYDREKGFPSNNLINTFNIRNELIFTTEYGIFHYQPETDSIVLDPFFTKIFGPQEQVWVMKEDSYGNIYFIGRDRCGVLRKNSMGEFTLETNTFNRIRTLLNDDLENLQVLSNNDVLFGAKEGFIHYDPRKTFSQDKRFQTLIRQVSVVNEQRDSILFFGNYAEDGKVADQQSQISKLTLPFSKNSIHFQYAATTFEGNEVLFQYYLENFEKTWSEWTTVTRKEYTNLKEGRYVFHVRARNVNGEASKEALFTFFIDPPWYRSMVAIAAYIILIVVALYVAFFLLDRKYQREQSQMRLKQEEILILKENEIENMAQKSQEEINRLQNEKLESELMHINKELGTSTFHLLNKNEFISGVKGHLTSILKKNHSPEVQKELHRIVLDIEENISTDADWEHFQIHFDRAHGDFSNRFRIVHPNLSPQEIKLSAYLRMNLSTKEIAQLLHISVRGVEISRYRLRKKLALDRSTNLQEYILGF